MPDTIGVLTSKTGSVIRDIINVATRRNPKVHIRLYPIPVQGEKAEIKIAEAIECMNENKFCDVIILARGGGSIEDLWPFNEEITARAIYKSQIPIISAVGHETDFTIADFVADLRAPTPSAAAELAQPDVEEIKYRIDVYKKRMKTSLKKSLEFNEIRYKKIMSSKVFTAPLQRVNDEYVKIDRLTQSMVNSIMTKIKDCKIRLVGSIAKLDTLSPLKTLTRGYSITQVDGKIVRSVHDLKTGDKVNLRFQDGAKDAIIK